MNNYKKSDTPTTEEINDYHNKLSSSISNIVSIHKITVKDGNDNTSSGEDDISDENNNKIDDEIHSICVNYSTIVSRVMVRDVYDNFVKSIPYVVQQKSTPQQCVGYSTMASAHGVGSMATDIYKNSNQQSQQYGTIKKSICTDIKDLAVLGIVKKNKCSKPNSKELQIIKTPNTNLVIPTKYKCKTCSADKIFTGTSIGDSILLNCDDTCYDGIGLEALRGINSLSLKKNYDQFALRLRRIYTWSLYLQCWHRNRFHYCERIGSSKIDGVCNFVDGEFAIRDVQLLKSRNYLPVIFTTTYNNFHLIQDLKNEYIPTTANITHVNTTLASFEPVNITSQEELLIILRRLYVRMARIINDSIILLNGRFEIPLIFTYEFTKIQILRTTLVDKIRFKRKIKLGSVKLTPLDFNISDIFKNTNDNLFEMIKKNNEGILLYNITSIGLSVKKDDNVQLIDIHEQLSIKIRNIITSGNVRNSKRALFAAMVLRDDIADCEKLRQGLARIF